MRRRHALKTALGGIAAPFVLGAEVRAQASRDGVLRIVNAVELDTLDPHAVLDTGRLNFKINVYDSLFRFQGNPPKLEPWLADKLDASPDGTVYTLHLKHGVKFHDGTEMTADDVVYAMERMLAMKQGPSRLYLDIVAPGATRAVDRYTVEFKLKRAAAPFEELLAECYIVNSALVKKNEKNGDWGREWMARNTASSGSWVVTSWEPSTGWEADRFKDHFKGWQDKAPTGVRFRTMREANSQALAMQRGDIDLFVGTLSVDQIEKMAKSANVAPMREPNLRLLLLSFNTKKPPFDDPHVRRAFSMAFDYEGWLNGIMKGAAVRATGAIPPQLPGAVPKPLFNYDLKAAADELAKATAKVDRPVSIHVMTGIARTEQCAQVLQAGLKSLGITANIVSETWPTLANRCRAIETTPDIMTIWTGPEYLDLQNWVGDAYDQTRWGDYKSCTYFSSDEITAKIKRAYSSLDPAERLKLYSEVAVAAAEGAASIYVHSESWLGVRNKRVQGFVFCPSSSGNDLRSAWLADIA